MTTSTPLNITLLYGSYRTERAGIRVVKHLQQLLQKRGHQVSILDAKEINLPILDRMYKEYEKGKAPAPLEKVAETLRTSDAFVVVAGEYNHGVQPGLKNLMDHFLEEYFYRPSAIACYSAGIFGGVRAAMQWRMILCELGTPSIPSLLPIGKVSETLDDAGNRTDGKESKGTEKFLKELEWYANAFREGRNAENS